MERTDEPAMTVEVDALPMLATPVAIAGAEYRQEVGGSVCFSTVVGVAIYHAMV